MNDAFDWASSKKAINECRANEIADAISTPEGRVKLLVGMWYPLDFPLPGETEEQRIARRYQELVAREEMHRRENEDNGKS